MHERMGEKRMEERSEEEQEQTPSPEPQPEYPVEFLSPEEQERVMREYAEPQLDGLRLILRLKQEQLQRGPEAEGMEVLRKEIAELEQTISEMAEFIEDVSLEPEGAETQEFAEKRERIIGLLREAARQYQEDHEKGHVVIEFLGDSGNSWFQPDQVAEVTDTEVIFSDGKTFPLQYVGDVELEDFSDEESGEESSEDAPA